MLIQELQIEGFRSLKSVTWRPGRLNVLIGPNGGGKSNLLRALDLIRASATGGLNDAVIRMGGMAPLVWDGEARRIRFALDLSDEASPPRKSRYEIILNRLGNTGGFEQVPKKSASLRKGFRDWSIHNDMRVDQEAELRRAAVTRSERRVCEDGQNLIAVLHTLYENLHQFEDFIDNAMAAAFPDDYDKLTFPPAEHGRTEMRIRRKYRKSADSAADLSDGTLRFLLLIAILGNPDPAPLIAIDEPETGLHPRMLPIIAEVAANAAMKTQVIFTTHAPQLLDAFGEDLPTTTIVTSNGSESELKTVGGKDLKRWVANYSLGKFAFSGEADAVL
jgi:predicted ATPase